MREEFTKSVRFSLSFSFSFCAVTSPTSVAQTLQSQGEISCFAAEHCLAPNRLYSYSHRSRRPLALLLARRKSATVIGCLRSTVSFARPSRTSTCSTKSRITKIHVAASVLPTLRFSVHPVTAIPTKNMRANLFRPSSSRGRWVCLTGISPLRVAQARVHACVRVSDARREPHYAATT